MSDELSNVQAKQGVNPLWGLGGAVIGGGATAYGLHKYGYLTQPYKSTADLIKEKEDTFNGKKLNADEHVKAQDKAKSIIENAGSKYDADLKAYQEANKFGYKESPELNSLVEQKNALEKEIAEFGKETAAEPVSKPVSERKARKIARKTFMNGGKAPVADNSEYLKVKQEQLANVKKQLEAEKLRFEELTKNMNKVLREIEAEGLFNEPTKERQALINEKIKALVDKMEFTGTKEQIAIAKDAKYKEMQDFIQSVVAEREHNTSIVKVDVNKIAQAKNEAANTVKELTGKSIADVDVAEFERKVNLKVKAEELKVKKLEEFLDLYKKYTEEAKAAGQQPATFKEFSGEILDKKGKVTGKIKVTERIVNEARATFQDGLNEKQKAAFERLVGEGDEKAIQAAIKTHKETIQSLNDSVANLKKAIEQVKSSNALIEQYGGKGAIIKDGAIVRADGTKVEFKPEQITIAKEFTVPKTKKLVELEKTLAKLEAEINGTQSGVKLTPKQLAEKQSQLEELNSKINTLKNELKVERKPEELVTEFAEKNGSKRDAIIKALNEGKEELKPLFEKKWGTGKVAGAIAGLAAVGGLLGYLIAPKHSA